MSRIDDWADGDRLRVAVESAGLGLFEIDWRHDRLQWSARTRQIFGMTLEEPITRATLSQVIHPDDLVRVLRLVEQATDPAGDGAVQTDYRIVRRDGTVRWIGVRGQVHFDDAVTPRQAVRMIGTVLDITELEQGRMAQRQLDEEHQWLTLALAAGQMGLWEWNFTTGERRWNPAMYDLYGVDPARVTTLAPPHVEEILAEDAPGLQQEIRRLRAEGGSSQVEFRIRRRDDGRVRWILSRGVMRRDSGVERMFGVSYDITERKTTEQALLDADRRKDEFLAMLAHELRNPLAPLTNALRLLERGGRLDDRDRMALAMAERQTRQLQRLVDDLLEVNRITRGRIELRLAPMEVSGAVRDATASVLPAMRQRDQRLQVDLPERCAPIVADAARVAQVLENLLHNASKYTPAGGEIRVEVHDRPETIEIRVADNGIGMEPDAIGRIFDLFVQADATLDRSQGGLGIGLALVRRLVELHGGSVGAASPGKGQGATFTVTLPRRQDGAGR